MDVLSFDWVQRFQVGFRASPKLMLGILRNLCTLLNMLKETTIIKKAVIRCRGNRGKLKWEGSTYIYSNSGELFISSALISNVIRINKLLIDCEQGRTTH